MRKIVLISIIILSTLLFLNMVEAQNQIMCLGNFPDSVSSPCTGNLNLSSTDLCTYGFESLLDGFSNVSTIGDESAIQNVSLTMWHSDCDGSDINFLLNEVTIKTIPYYLNASAIDTAGNLNKTEIRTVLVATNIIFGNVTYNPNTTDLLDPTTNVTFNVNITSITGNISIVKLQFHNSSGWVNYSAYNITNITYQVNVTLPGTNASNSYNFWANTTIGASLETSNATLGSFCDCSWSVNPISFEELSGYFQSKQLGNISINNSGDVSYSTNNCSIIFTITQISSTFSTDYLVATFPSGTPRGM